MHKSDELKEAVLDFIAGLEDGISTVMSILGSGDWIDFAAKNKEWANEIIEAVRKKLITSTV